MSRGGFVLGAGEAWQGGGMDQAQLAAIERQLQTILMGWGAASTALGSALWWAGWRSGRTDLLRFGRQAALWGAIDAAIAGAGIAQGRRRGELDEAQIERQARRLQIILVANGLADVVYVVGGVRVWARTGSSRSGRAGQTPTYLGMGRGDGVAIVIQGGFLLGLDAAFALRVARARR
jgi:hypothetical protein